MENSKVETEQEFLGNKDTIDVGKIVERFGLPPVPETEGSGHDMERISQIDAEVELSWRAAENGGWHDSWHKLQSRIDRGEASPAEARNWVIGKLFLIIDEITEAGGELRKGRDFTEVYYTDPKDERKADEPKSNEDGTLNKPEGFLVELADAVVRIEDLVGIVTEGSPSFGQLKLDKIAYNGTRGQMHGGAKF